ncbi:amino acid deaminase/aldolase [Pontibacillus litoralis]|uniref:Amino acid aldolase n=1 Tax=Pontibacillus litoralis JSM 072002 TaxID=1385512 RepID=A0A0A5G788_9BACI|nr:amino acid deaminase/aldolase [Pontibacillus litoralis]KGX87008.1 amino acid aldolase [Pontibacillus litoralis JSM 072002]
MIHYSTFNQLPAPAAYLDIEALDANCAKVAEQANGKKIRIASKSIRSIQVMKRILASNDCFHGVMCYNPREAVFLLQEGFDDVLIAYPTMDHEALKQISEKTQEGKLITVMVDCVEHVELLEHIANQSHGMFRVCVDVDMSLKQFGLYFGVRRSPLRTTEEVLSVVDAIGTSPSLRLDGVMGYEAQVAGVADNLPGKGVKNHFIRWLKKRSLQEFPNRRKAIVEAIQQKGLELRFVNGGGTGSLHSTVQEAIITEVTIGSAFFSPHLFDHYEGLSYSPALFYTTPIVRRAAPSIYTCYSGGYVASGEIGEDKRPQLYMPASSRLITVEGAGEVQTPFIFHSYDSLNIGDVAVFRHSKAGEVTEHFQVLHAVQDGHIIDSFNTYRGDGQCFH